MAWIWILTQSQMRKRGLQIQIDPKAGDSDSDLDLAKYVSITPIQFISLLHYMTAANPHLPNRNLLHPHPPKSEARRAEEMIATIQLHTQHQDPYEDWEKNIRSDTFVHCPSLSLFLIPS